MIIVVEGIDKTGKSTLVQEMKRLLGSSIVEVLHANRPTKHPLDEYELSLAAYEPGILQHILLDRWHLGETVWPRVFNRETVYDEFMHKHVELFLLSRGVLLVLAEARESVLLDRIGPDDYFVPAQVPTILQSFKTAAKGSLLHRVPYDFERDRLTDFAFAAIRAAYALEYEVSRVHSVSHDWIGWPRPTTLFVGEQTKEDNGHGIPFVPFKTTSGYHLMKALANSHVGQHSYAITNALKPDGEPEHLKQLWATMNRPRIVALGNVAHEALTALDMHHGTTPHPQWMRRFNHAVDYGEILDAAFAGVDTRKRFIQ